MAGSSVPNDPNMTKEVRTFLDGMKRDLGAITTTQIGAAGTTQIEYLSGFIALPTNKDYRISERLPYDVTLTGITTKTASGTCTVTTKINTTAATGGAVSTTSTSTTSVITAANAGVEGDALVLTISANASAVDLSFTLEMTRVLAN